ncbi:L-glutamate gamma-semialdehyde dehydrogenase [Paenibacillus silviterrae]|uniref:L-glutamate gamma-semialdehyde dehydrogenase n=1 Tax=Paenibacillus silviterrae TaxID=3242194 RepID=UPI003557921A
MIDYRPEPLTNFKAAREEEALAKALAEVQAQLGRDYPIVLGGRSCETGEWIVSRNPSRHSEVVGRAAKANLSLAEQAIQEAYRTFASWSQVKAEVRADVLFKAAAILRRRKHEFSAWMMLEAGKNRVEADADTAEAIDFMEYYARQMLELDGRGAAKLVHVPGERSQLVYLPLGVGIVIPPWNFPLAILAGMTTAAVVAGNTVVVKPSSQTPVIAARFVSLLAEAGLPDGVVQFLPGSGAEIGDYLVAHKLTRFVSFTGSREVGVHLHKLSAEVQPGQIWLKRYVGELGGKDAIIVDEDADLEEASAGIIASAFGFSGQKCSACSRAIIHDAVYDEVVERCRVLSEQLKLGPATDAASDLGPVIDRAAYRKIVDYIEAGRQEGRLLTGGTYADDIGYYIAPTIFADVAPGARLMQEEIFGPVLAFASAVSFEEALQIANFSDYGLTGAVYTNNRENIERAKAAFHVGNLYINRKCTGATVGVHPFGGFNMSGTDSKAGGPDYLLLFTQPKLIAERL